MSHRSPQRRSLLVLASFALIAAMVGGLLLLSPPRGYSQGAPAIVNGSFDADIDGWEITQNDPGHSVEWSPMDEAADPASGSMEVSLAANGGADAEVVITQCIPAAAAGEEMYYAASSRYEAVQEVAAAAVATDIHFFAEADCSQFLGVHGAMHHHYNPFFDGLWFPAASSFHVPADAAALGIQTTFWANDGQGEGAAFVAQLDAIRLATAADFSPVDLPNSDFDIDLAGWTTYDSPYQSWFPLDASGAPGSGSLRMQVPWSSLGVHRQAAICIPDLTGDEGIALVESQHNYPPGQSGTGHVTISLGFSGSNDCPGGLDSDFLNDVIHTAPAIGFETYEPGDGSDGWDRLHSAVLVPPGARSALLTIRLDQIGEETDELVEAYFDDIQLSFTDPPTVAPPTPTATPTPETPTPTPGPLDFQSKIPALARDGT